MADPSFDASRYDLDSLHVFCTTGAAWTPEAWYWLSEVIGKRRAPIANFSGGTIAAAVMKGRGTGFRPKVVVLCDDLPKTRNLKIMRRVVRAALLGQEPCDLSSLVNPEEVEGLRRIAERAPHAGD